MWHGPEVSNRRRRHTPFSLGSPIETLHWIGTVQTAKPTLSAFTKTGLREAGEQGRTRRSDQGDADARCKKLRRDIAEGA
eukprot:1569748-Pyramimonas_sp.AAC.1